MSDKITLHRCPWENCDWSRYVIDGSKPSQAIDDIAYAGHIKEKHDGHLPAERAADAFDNLLGLFGRGRS